jgi:hypothetical protein
MVIVAVAVGVVFVARVYGTTHVTTPVVALKVAPVGSDTELIVARSPRSGSNAVNVAVSV